MTGHSIQVDAQWINEIVGRSPVVPPVPQVRRGPSRETEWSRPLSFFVNRPPNLHIPTQDEEKDATKLSRCRASVWKCPARRKASSHFLSHLHSARLTLGNRRPTVGLLPDRRSLTPSEAQRFAVWERSLCRSSTLCNGRCKRLVICDRKSRPKCRPLETCVNWPFPTALASDTASQRLDAARFPMASRPPHHTALSSSNFLPFSTVSSRPRNRLCLRRIRTFSPVVVTFIAKVWPSRKA